MSRLVASALASQMSSGESVPAVLQAIGVSPAADVSLLRDVVPFGTDMYSMPGLTCMPFSFAFQTNIPRSCWVPVSILCEWNTGLWFSLHPYVSVAAWEPVLNAVLSFHRTILELYPWTALHQKEKMGAKFSRRRHEWGMVGISNQITDASGKIHMAIEFQHSIYVYSSMEINCKPIPWQSNFTTEPANIQLSFSCIVLLSS